MRILFLDDDWERHSHFTMLHLGHEIVHVNRVADAKRALLAGERFDEVWLDHDLELAQEPVVQQRWVGRVRQMHRPKPWTKYECGADVARHIVAMAVRRRPKHVFVHSVNERGAAHMVEMLRAAKVPVTRIVDLDYERADAVRGAWKDEEELVA